MSPHLREKYDDLAPALHGLMDPRQQCLLEQLLGHIDDLATRSASFDEELVRRVDPQEAALSLFARWRRASCMNGSAKEAR